MREEASVDLEEIEDRDAILREATGAEPVVGAVSMARWLLLGILLAAAWFFHGFLVPVLAAAVIAVATWPLHQRLQARGDLGPTASAIVLVGTVALVLILPIALAIVYAVGEFQAWVDWAIRTNAEGAAAPSWIVSLPGNAWLVTQWDRFVGMPGGISRLFAMVDGPAISSMTHGALAAGRRTFALILAALFLLITLFVFYRSGADLVAQLDVVGARVLGRRWQRLSRVVPRTIGATVSGMTLIAIGEGIVFGIAYWVAGVPSPATFAIATGLMALFPGGAPLSMSLVAVYLAASGQPGAAGGLFAWGTLQLFIVDKTIRPALVGGPIKLPFLPTIFGLVGGVKTMGIVGLFVGPVLMALLVSIWREWVREIRMSESGLGTDRDRADPGRVALDETGLAAAALDAGSDDTRTESQA